MIQLSITKCSKSFNPKDVYSIFDVTIENFESIQAAKKWINENYPNKRKNRMYNDNYPNSILGYVIGFRNSEYYDGKENHFLEQHWIEFRENKPLIIKVIQN